MFETHINGRCFFLYNKSTLLFCVIKKPSSLIHFQLSMHMLLKKMKVTKCVILSVTTYFYTK